MRYRPDQSCQPVSSQTPNAIRSNRHGWWMVDGTLAAAVHIIYRMYIPYVIGYGHTRSLYVCYICSIHNILIVNSVAPCPRYCSKSDKGCMFLEVNDSNGLKNTLTRDILKRSSPILHPRSDARFHFPTRWQHQKRL